ncbi:MAG: hypothetical protein LBV54_08765 [Puniceicoccales bacterium]|jgi:hypothetical protein|nr:hypothetical protein [Puniceicoccales bacterium]
MNITPFAHLAALCGFLVVLASSATAQQVPPAAKGIAPVEVTAVKFSNAKVGGLHSMNRMEVELRALANAKILENPAAAVPNKEWVDKIRVTVTTAYERPAIPRSAAITSTTARKPGAAGAAGADASAPPPYVFYRATATIMTMERNGRGSLFFYLPGEIVKRDRLKLEPYAYLVEIDVDGTNVTTSKTMASKTIQKPEQLDGFKQMADRAVLDTAGVLRPQYMVPYDPVQASSPTLLREDTPR